MNFQKNLQIAIKALATNKLRSGLTMLGVVIGVGAVVALMALGNGASDFITDQVQGAGVNLIGVVPGNFEEQQSGPPTVEYMYYDDYEALRDNLPSNVPVIPSFNTSVSISYEEATSQVALTATTEDYMSARAYEIARGRNLVPGDNASGSRVVVLGALTAESLFGAVNPIGRSVKLDGVSFEVVGVFAEKGSPQEDQATVVPLQTAYNSLLGSTAIEGGQRLITDVLISAPTPDDVDRIMVDADRIMRRQHNLGFNEPPDFTIFSQDQLLETLGAITDILTTFLAAIAAISLIVGGVGIMNIMLVSVTERTREIGLRKALGAKRRTILAQFLIETMLLSFIGGALGILLGMGVAGIATALDIIDARVTIDAILLAFGFSAAVGIISGYYPAYRASRLRPIDALRYE